MRAAALALTALLLSGAAAGEPSLVARVRIVDALPPSPSVEARLEAIRRRIEGALVYPANARQRGLTGVAHLTFEIDTEGRARALETTRSSGHWVLDRAARRAVEDAAPLPYVWGRLEVPVAFTLER